MQEEVWPNDWLRGVLSLCVLRILSAGPTYGYAITAALNTAGLGSVKGGTLYPLLSRLEAAGLLSNEWREGDGGPGRKYFSLTTAGRRELSRQSALWTEFSSRTGALLNDSALGGASSDEGTLFVPTQLNNRIVEGDHDD